jgi:hypothetical protein
VAGSQQAIDEFEGRGFAGATAAQENESFSALHFEVQIVKQNAGVVAIAMQAIRDVAEFDGGASVARIAHVSENSRATLRTPLAASR